MATVPQIGAMFARYRIDSQLGFGGMGVVFAATDTAIDRTVALKVVSGALGGSAEFVRRFEREAALLARLDSPHVIEIYDFGEHDGAPYIATQYVRGGDLGKLLQDRGPMPPQLGLTVCAQVAEALSEAHQAGVIHRDVKASNVLLRDADTPDLHAYLCDFGIARSADSGGLTVAGSVSGTWTYLAPECGSGGQATPASDAYSVGCLLWATLTGKPPYVGSDVEVAIAHQQAPVPQLDGDDAFTRQTNVILSRTLAKDPADRYQDADQLRRDLLATAGLPTPGTIQPKPVSTRGLRASTPTPTTGPTGRGDGSGSGPAPTSTAPKRRRDSGPGRRRGLLVAAACLAVLLIAGGVTLAVAMLGPGSSDPDPDPAPTAAEPDGPVRGDRDGDGLGDLAARHHLDDGAVVDLYSWSSTGDGFGEPERERVKKRSDKRYYFLFDADFDGDEVFDAVRGAVGSKEGAPLRLSWTAPDGTEQTRKAQMPERKGQVGAVPADVDGDGRSDLVFVTYDYDRSKPLWYFVALATDDGFSETERWLKTDVKVDENSHAIGDFNGDGMADVAIATTVSLPDFEYRTRIQAYASTGSAFEEDLRTPAVDAYLGPELLAADVDGDGDDEAVLVSSNSSTVSVRVSDHTGERLLRPRHKGGVLTPAFTSRLTVSDVDGDGRDDIVHAYVPESESGRRQLLEVATSNGDGFDNAAQWGLWRLDKPGDYVGLVGSLFP